MNYRVWLSVSNDLFVLLVSLKNDFYGMWAERLARCFTLVGYRHVCKSMGVAKTTTLPAGAPQDVISNRLTTSIARRGKPACLTSNKQKLPDNQAKVNTHPY